MEFGLKADINMNVCTHTLMIFLMFPFSLKSKQRLGVSRKSPIRKGLVLCPDTSNLRRAPGREGSY